MPLPAIAVEVVRRVASPIAFQAMLNSGANYRDERAVEVGLADKIVDKEKLRDSANEHAQRMAAIPAATFQVMKQQIRDPSLAQAERLEKKFGQEIRDVWNSSEVRAMIEDYAAKL